MKILLLLLTLFSSIYYFTGFFVIQPIGAIPEGTTIWYIRTETKLPFIGSPDGILLETQGGVNLIGRVMVVNQLSDTILKKKIVVFPYLKPLYLISTGGKEFSK